MKAERRHELQTNTLALWLRWKAPDLWAKYGTHILLGVIIILLGIVVIRHLINKPTEEANRAAELLTSFRVGQRCFVAINSRPDYAPGNSNTRIREARQRCAKAGCVRQALR